MQAIQPSQSGTATYNPGPLVDSGDLGAELAAVEIQTGDTERSAEHAQRSLDEVAEEQADEAQVQQMHDEASSMRTEAWVNGGIGVVEAVAGFGFQPSPTGTPTTWGAASTAVTTGAEKLADGLFSASQHDDEANAAGDKAAADRYASDAKDASDAANDATSFVSNALDFARSYVATEAQTQAAALHRA
jgi:hypothetical protein